jgi:hypothetical protein
MGKVRMLHPSSGRDNFTTVSNQATASANTTVDQATNQNAAQTVDKKEVEEKTNDAIKAATAPQPQPTSNNTTSKK